MDDKELLNYAKEAMKKAYAPYSHFKVGAAIVGSNGQIYTGCNIENSSYGATICAERTAAVKAVSDGCTEFITIAVVCSSGEFAYPCGICRQFLSEFFNKDGEIIVEDHTNGIMHIPFYASIPFTFTGDCIK